MSDAREVDDGGLLRSATRAEVLVLGAGGLARRLTVGPLREQGLVVHDELDAAGAAEGGVDLTARSPQGYDPAGAGPANPVVGLLVNPSSEHWHEASARQVPVVVVQLERPTDEGVVDAVLRGAEAVVSAHDEPEELVEVIDAVAAGATLLTPHQARWVAEAARGRRREAAPVDALTRRELDILLSIDRGETVKQTARSLGISAKTVENLQSRLFRKLAVRNRAQAVSRAHALGLLSVATEGDAPAVIELSTSDGELRARRPY